MVLDFPALKSGLISPHRLLTRIQGNDSRAYAHGRHSWYILSINSKELVNRKQMLSFHWGGVKEFPAASGCRSLWQWWDWVLCVWPVSIEMCHGQASPYDLGCPSTRPANDTSQVAPSAPGNWLFRLCGLSSGFRRKSHTGWWRTGLQHGEPREELAPAYACFTYTWL